MSVRADVNEALEWLVLASSGDPLCLDAFQVIGRLSVTVPDAVVQAINDTRKFKEGAL